MEIEFRNSVVKYLYKLDDSIKNAIEKLTDYEYPTNVVLLDFEVFSDSFTIGSPIRTFFLDKENNEFFIYTDGKAQYPSPIPPEIFNVNCIYPDSLENEFKDTDLDLWNIATDEFIKWFAHKWKQHKNVKFNLNAIIGHHDDSRKFDLMKQEWFKS